MKVFIMKLQKQDKINKIISIVLLVLWCLLIFYFSNQKGSTSLGSSNQVIEFINLILKKFNSNSDITSFKYISFVVRKLAHIFLYFILYFLAYYTAFQFNIKKRKFLSLLFCFLYAVSDEFHQLFIPNRSFGFTDILIDTLGSLLASFLIQIKQVIKTCKNH